MPSICVLILGICLTMCYAKFNSLTEAEHAYKIKVIEGNRPHVYKHVRMRNRANTITISPIDTVQKRQRSADHVSEDFRSNFRNLVEVKIMDNDAKHDQRHRNKKTKVSFLNARSIRKNYDSINDFVTLDNPDVLAITETWIADNESDAWFLREITPPGYEIENVNRSNGRGGGVAIIARTALRMKKLHCVMYQSFESMLAQVTTTKGVLRIAAIYRPPSGSMDMFINEFRSFLEKYCLTGPPIVLVGDFNIHIDSTENLMAKSFMELLDTFDMSQHVSGPTHEKGHTLDLIVSRNNDPLVISGVRVMDKISDHFIVQFSVSYPAPQIEKKSIAFRKIKDIEIDKLSNDLQQMDIFTNFDNITDLDVLVDRYNTALHTVLDKHAPLIERNITSKAHAPWHKTELLDSRRRYRRLERKYRKTGRDEDKRSYKSQLNAYFKAKEAAKKLHYNNKITESKGDSGALFKVANQLLHRRTQNPLPDHSDTTELCNDFASFFKSKIDKIRSNFDDLNVEAACCFDQYPEIDGFRNFRLLSLEETKRLISSSAPKSCALDPFPTTILKQCSDIVAPLVQHIINMSLSQGHMPTMLKKAIVTPLLKKSSLERICKNYRPVSNLPFLGKLIEKAVCNQFSTYISDNDLSEPLQSAYKQYHSTETALVKILNDVLLELDNRNIVMAGFLDLSAAFDTVDYNVLFQRLETSYALNGTVMDWFRSYLQDRTQTVSIAGCNSKPVGLDCGMPQGSMLGPKIYNEYTKPIGSLLRVLMLIFHSYADDSQLTKSANPLSLESQRAASNTLQSSIESVGKWMNNNRLKLNEDKTEFMVFSSRRNSSRIVVDSLSIGDEVVPRVPKVRNLGVLLDSELSFEIHINNLCRLCYANIKAIWKIRRFLNLDTAKVIVHALVISRLDYANALLFGLPDKLLRKLQLVQNAAARVVFRSRRYDRIKPLLKQLHWLPIKERIEFKVLVLVFKAQNDLSPLYLKELLTPYMPSRQLRSATSSQLVQPTYNLKGYGYRAFSVAGPRLWNILPYTIRTSDSLVSFKKCLKTYYFKKAFNC